MKNFVYQSPTTIYFGENQISQLETELLPYKNKVILLVYGKSSIKILGIYDKIMQIAKSLYITVIEEGNVTPNPDISAVNSGIAKCLEHHVSFVLAAGGGSAIDCAKAIAFGAKTKGNIWDIYLRKFDATSSLPLGVIITLAATGTETNGNSVISNNETSEKRSVAYPFSVPKFAVIDPSYTITVNEHHTISGSLDIIMHILEQYFSNTTRTETSDYMSFGVIKSVIENTRRVLDGDNTYHNRANISWASTIGLNWILGVDKVGDWATHRLSYAITKEFGTTHGLALILIFTSWMRTALKYNPKTMNRRLALIGKELFQLSEPDLVINKMESLFQSFGAKTNFEDEGIQLTSETINSLVDNALALGSVGTVITIDKKIATEIFELAKGASHGKL